MKKYREVYTVKILSDYKTVITDYLNYDLIRKEEEGNRSNSYLSRFYLLLSAMQKLDRLHDGHYHYLFMYHEADMLMGGIRTLLRRSGLTNSFRSYLNGLHSQLKKMLEE